MNLSKRGIPSEKLTALLTLGSGTGIDVSGAARAANRFS